MIKKLIQTYTRTSLSQPKYYPCKEEFLDEWNYIQSKYGVSLPTVETLNTDPSEVSRGSLNEGQNPYIFTFIKQGEESIINEFISEVVSSNGRLHNRVIWCENNGIQYNYEITDV